MEIPTLNEATAAVGRTWFSFSDNDDRIVITSRRHGNIGAEIPGEADIFEGRRICKVLCEKYPNNPIVFDTIDEWVHVSVRIEPFTKEEKLIFEQRAIRDELSKRVKEFVAEIKVADIGVRLHYDCGYQCEGHPFRQPTITLIVKSGERLLFKNDPGTEIKYKTADEAEAAARAVVSKITGIPLGDWVLEPVRPLYEQTTSRNRAPYNIIERSSEVNLVSIVQIQ
jgi:hypothetical protein